VHYKLLIYDTEKIKQLKEAWIHNKIYNTNKHKKTKAMINLNLA